LAVFRFLRSEPASLFWGEAGRKNKNPFPRQLLFFGQILGGGKICLSLLMSKEQGVWSLTNPLN